jgi:hypothetical protein
VGASAVLAQRYEAPRQRANSAMIAALDTLKAVYQPQASSARAAAAAA